MYRLLVLLLIFTAVSAADYQRVWSGVECGESEVLSSRDLTGKIVGGQEAEKGEFPWQVSLRTGSWHFCGGTVISERWIVSAAHCVYGKSPRSLDVVTNAHERLDAGEVHEVEEVIAHPDYDYHILNSDIALLKLRKPLTFGAGMQPACAPKPDPTLYYKAMSVVSGWGTTSSGGTAAKTLMWVALPIPSNEECQKCFDDELNSYYIIDKSMLCAGRTPETEFDACQGDSGGPLVVSADGHWELVGAVSWGYSCAAGPPGVYANVPYFHDWITEQLKSD